MHLVYAGHMPNVFYESPGAWTLDGDLTNRMQERAEEAAITRLEEQVQSITDAGGRIAQAHAKAESPALPFRLVHQSA